MPVQKQLMPQDTTDLRRMKREAFLKSLGWKNVALQPLQADASFRRYFRLRKNGESAMLMHAPPPHEDPGPFIEVAKYLVGHGLRAPEIIAAQPETGWVLLEDFGNDRMRDWLDRNPGGEQAAYEGAIDALVHLHKAPAGPFAPYDMAAYAREFGLFTEWYCPAQALEVDTAGFARAFTEAFQPLLARQQPGVTVLRDYHAENIMLLGDPRHGAGQGLIDFQDALVGHAAYDLVSLLQDARRDVSPDLERDMLARYAAATGAG